MQADAADSIGATYELASRLAQTGQATQAQLAQLLQAANDDFMPAFHAAAFVSLGLLVVAIILYVVWLPADAEHAEWAAQPGAPTTQAAASAAPPPADAAPLTDAADERHTADGRRAWPGNPPRRSSGAAHDQPTRRSPPV